VAKLIVKVPSVPPHVTTPGDVVNVKMVVHVPTQVAVPVESMRTELPLVSDSLSSGGVAAEDSGAVVRANVATVIKANVADAEVLIFYSLSLRSRDRTARQNASNLGSARKMTVLGRTCEGSDLPIAEPNLCLLSTNSGKRAMQPRQVLGSLVFRRLSMKRLDRMLRAEVKMRFLSRPR
jgi:hypothetical protein